MYVPDTIITNNPSDLRDFYEKYKGNICFKLQKGAVIRTSEGNKVLYTNKVTEEQMKNLISHLVSHPNCIELISISGDFDITCVLIAKNTKELNEVSYKIRQRFKDIISDWRTSINLEVHKFEWYDFMQLT